MYSIVDKLAALGRSAPPSHEEAAYRRLDDAGYRPQLVIDVGAYQGNWTRLAKRIFPCSQVLMVEPQASQLPHLERACDELTDVRYASALLAERSGERVTFYEMETGSSYLPERSNVARSKVELVTSTLDDLVPDPPGSTFLKLDVQGAELDVLRGGERVLKACTLIQLEVALLPYNDGAPSMLEVLSDLDARNFVPFDISGFTRPNGRDLAQIDLLFVPRDSPLRRTFFEF